MKVALWSFLLFFLCCPEASFSAPEEEKKKEEKFGVEWSLHTGPLLPNLVQGMDEILLTWGGRFGWPTSKGRVEMGMGNGRGDGVEYYTASLSLRGDVVVEDLTGIFYIGLDGHYYTYPGSNAFVFLPGGHVGGGIMAPLGGQVWFRSDMKFNVNPGTALYIGFGFVIRGFPGEGGGSEGEKK